MSVIGKQNTKDALGNRLRYKRKAAEAQVQQELSPDPSLTRVANQNAWVPAREPWVPAREPMTGAQANALKLLAEEMKEPQAFDAGLSKSEASRRIYRLQERLRLGQLPPHTD
jgi:hypothetical protein